MTVIRADAADLVLELPGFETGAANHSLATKCDMREDCAVPDPAIHEPVDLCLGATEFFGNVLGGEDFAQGRWTHRRLWLSGREQAFPEYLWAMTRGLFDSVMK